MAEMIDFSRPLTVVIEKWPPEISQAAKKIRREIQRLHGEIDPAAHADKMYVWAFEIRTLHQTRAPKLPADRAQRALDDWVRLRDAYHAWARTCSPAPPLTDERIDLLHKVMESAGVEI